MAYMPQNVVKRVKQAAAQPAAPRERVVTGTLQPAGTPPIKPVATTSRTVQAGLQPPGTHSTVKQRPDLGMGQDPHGGFGMAGNGMGIITDGGGPSGTPTTASPLKAAVHNATNGAVTPQKFQSGADWRQAMGLEPGTAAPVPPPGQMGEFGPVKDLTGRAGGLGGAAEARRSGTLRDAPAGGFGGLAGRVKTVQAGLQPAATPQSAAATPTPPAPPVGGIPGVAGAAVTSIDPTNDLRSTAITPQGGPDLTGLAQQQFKDFLANNADTRATELRKIGQSAAKFGRLGSGMVTTDIGNLQDVLARRELEAARGLSADVARGTLDENRANRGELRGERDFQTGRSDNAIDRQIQQRLLEENLLNSEFGRNMDQARLAYEGNRDMATEYSDDSSSVFDSLGQMLTEHTMRPGRAPVMTPPTFPTSTPRIVTQPPPTPRLPRI